MLGFSSAATGPCGAASEAEPAVLILPQPLPSGFGGCVGTGFLWNVSRPALDLALDTHLFEAAGGVYPANQDLGHMACRIMGIPPGRSVG